MHVAKLGPPQWGTRGTRKEKGKGRFKTKPGQRTQVQKGDTKKTLQGGNEKEHREVRNQHQRNRGEKMKERNTKKHRGGESMKGHLVPPMGVTPARWGGGVHPEEKALTCRDSRGGKMTRPFLGGRGSRHRNGQPS